MRYKENDVRDRDPTPARAALLRLLQRGEDAAGMAVDRKIRLAMTKRDCPEYAALNSLTAFEAFEAEIALAALSGAVRFERRRHAEGAGSLEEIVLVDTRALAEHLGIPSRQKRLQDAEAQLAPWRSRHGVLSEILQLWRQGKTVRRRGTDAAADIADAARAIAARESAGDQEERILRRESVRIFGDSKRLEALAGWIEMLWTGEIAVSGMEPEHVWSALGLRREPQPALLAGRAEVRIDRHTIPVPYPYLGVPVAAVDELVTDARVLLSVENLASFHDAARASGARDILLVYTGGMPSPSWRRFYARILAGVPADCAIHHWGDIDEGGYRIAAVLAGVVRASGRTLQPWLMSPDQIDENGGHPASERTATRMREHASKAGWNDIAEAIERRPVTLEQEAFDPEFPQ